MSSLILSISVVELDLSCTMMTNLSRTFFSSSPITGGYILSFANTSEASGYTSHVCHAALLHFQRKTETTSQPVNVSKKGSPFDFTEPIECLMSCIGILVYVERNQAYSSKWDHKISLHHPCINLLKCFEADLSCFIMTCGHITGIRSCYYLCVNCEQISSFFLKRISHFLHDTIQLSNFS